MRSRSIALLVVLAACAAAPLGQSQASQASQASQTSQASQAPPAAPDAPLFGFSAAHAGEQRALEARFDSFLRAEDQRDWMQRLTAHPHHLGSPHDKANAEFMAGLFRSWGFDTAIEEFRGFFPTPRLRRLEMVAPTRFTAALAEPPIAEDRTSGQTAEQLPTYAAYSVDGDVTGDLVYVNFGLPKDYEELARHGVEVRGKIALARYGHGFRGAKPKLAAEHGAIGCIVYSDPHDDGYFLGDTYPAGGYRPAQGVQRGGYAADPHYRSSRLGPAAAWQGKGVTLDDVQRTSIPTLPISAADALPLLRSLAGPVAPEDWRGALPVPYHLGPGPARVHLAVASDWRLTPVYDVIARLPGRERPEEWVLRGNHHDAWVYGATDPVSGIVTVLAEARAAGELARQGWRPRRTILYAAWDGEEPALMGSTAWIDTHAAELVEHLAAYINSDSDERGFIYSDGSQTLATLAAQACRDVIDPETGVSVAARARADAIVEGDEEQTRWAREGRPLPVYPTGGGSDHVPFLFFLGAASLDTAFGGEEAYGQYHSIYDSYDHFTRFIDPGFRYGVALAKTAGRMVLRLADADVLPLDFTPFAEGVGEAITEVVKRTDAMRQETAETNRRIADRTYELAADPTLHLVVPAPRETVPYLNFAPLHNAAAALERSAGAYGEAMARAAADGFALPAGSAAELDRLLTQAEHTLTRPEGLPRRPWNRHQIYGELSFTGRGVSLPGVREALERRDWNEASAQIAVAAQVLEDFARQVDRATAVLRRGAAAVPVPSAGRTP